MVAILFAATAALLLQGCGSGGGKGPAAPNGIALAMDRSSVQVTRTLEVEAVNTYRGRTSHPDCDWYVDGVLGGNPATGTITQTNPATYTAPPVVPPGGSVEISAVSRADTTFVAEEEVDVLFTIKYVDGTNGSNTSGGGAWTNRLKTITFALDQVSPGDTIFVFPGNYGPDTGEGDRYVIWSDVTVRGAHRDSCFISGGGDNYSMIFMNDGSGFESFTIVNSLEEEIGILASGSGVIRDVATEDWFDHSAIRSEGDNARDGDVLLIENCSLTNMSDPHVDRGMELIKGTHCIVRGCTVSGWGYGIFINEDSDPLIEDCTITDNGFGVICFGGSGMLTQPDLGGGARGGSGGNVIRDNVDVGLSNGTEATIWALYNTWTNDPPTEGPPFPADFQNTGGGTIVWTR